MPGILGWFLIASAGAVMSTGAQPVSVCYNDEQCSTGFFCKLGLSCQECLDCDRLKREAPAFATSCIKSVAECGPCLQGLVVDRRSESDVTHAPCVPAARPDGAGLYIWLIVGLVTLGVFIAMVIVVVFARRKKDLFRISTATWLRSCGPEPAASAPEPPPPYNPYSPVRPDSPYSAPLVAYSPPPAEQESSDPFIKRAPAPPPAGAREAAGRQRARVYDPPAYVRVHPQSPVSPLAEEESQPWPAIHSEDTAPHDWTPDTSTNDDNVNPPESEARPLEAAGASSSALPALLAAARETTLVAPPAKKLKTQDNNNNGSRGASSAEGEEASGGRAPSLYFNIVQINNTKL